MFHNPTPGNFSYIPDHVSTLKNEVVEFDSVLYVKSVQKKGKSGKGGQVQAPEAIISALYDFP